MEEGYFLGKIALITGSSRGLGRVYAEKLAEKIVILHARTNESAAYYWEAESVESVAQEFLEKGYMAKFMTADIRVPEQVEKLIDDIVLEFWHIDILINNAGGNIGHKTACPSGSAIDIDIDDIISVVSRNLVVTRIRWSDWWDHRMLG